MLGILCFLSHVGEKVVYFYVLCFCYCFFFVLFLASLNNEVVLLLSVSSAFFCNKTKWFLVCILWFCFFVCCFALNFCFGGFVIPLKKGNNGHNQNTKNKNAEKKGHFLSVSAVVFTDSVPNFGGWALGLKMHLLLKTRLQ